MMETVTTTATAVLAAAMAAPIIDGSNTADATVSLHLAPPHATRSAEMMPSVDALEDAVRLLDRLEIEGVLGPDRVAMALKAMITLTLWGVPAPTDLSDGTDEDFSVIWQRDGRSASLTFTNDEVTGYAFRPGMARPWTLVGDTIDIVQLNTFWRSLGVSTPALPSMATSALCL